MPGFGHAPPGLLRAQFLEQRQRMVGREEQRRLGARQGFSRSHRAAPFVNMGRADQAGIDEILAEMPVDAGQQPAVPGEIDRDAGSLFQCADVAIGQHLVVEPGAFDKVDVARRGQPDPPYSGRILLRDARQTKCSLGRRAGQDHPVRTEPVLPAHEILDQEAGLEQRAEDHPLGLMLRVMLGIGRQPRILVIDRAHRLPMGGQVGEAARGDLARDQVELACHRQIAIDPLAHRDIGALALDHARMAPHRHDAEAFGCGEKVPVAETVARHGIGDVVRGDREAFDLDPHRALGEFTRIDRGVRGLVQIVAADMDLNGGHRQVSL